MSTEAHSEPLDAADTEETLAADAVWPLTCTMVFLALFALWYFRFLDIPFAPIALVLTAAIGVHFVAFWFLESRRDARLVPALVTAVHLIGVCALGITWVLIGGSEVAAFLLFFAAPVAAAAVALHGWVRLTNVAVTLVAIAGVALAQQPAFKWYLAQRGVSSALINFTTRLGTVAAPPRQPEASIVMALLGAAALTCVAIFSARMAGSARRLQDRLRRTVQALRARRGLALQGLDVSPFAEALILADTGQVLFANARFRAVRLQFPEVLQPLIAGEDGSVECSFRDERGALRTAMAHVHHTEHVGARMARLRLEDRSDARRLGLALECLADVMMVIDADDHIMHLNSGALRLFPDARPEGPATALNRPDLPDGWWRTAPGTTVPRNLAFLGEQLVGTVTHRPAEADAGSLTVVALRRGPVT